jgi:hypothetical protein
MQIGHAMPAGPDEETRFVLATRAIRPRSPPWGVTAAIAMGAVFGGLSGLLGLFLFLSALAAPPCTYCSGLGGLGELVDFFGGIVLLAFGAVALGGSWLAWRGSAFGLGATVFAWVGLAALAWFAVALLDGIDITGSGSGPLGLLALQVASALTVPAVILGVGLANGRPWAWCRSQRQVRAKKSRGSRSRTRPTR